MDVSPGGGHDSTWSRAKADGVCFRARVGASSRQQPEHRDQQHEGGDPPHRVEPIPFRAAAKLAFDEIVVIEVGLRQIEPVLCVLAPARLVIGAAFRAGEGISRHLFAADRADLRRGRTRFPWRHRQAEIGFARNHSTNCASARERWLMAFFVSGGSSPKVWS